MRGLCTPGNGNQLTTDGSLIFWAKRKFGVTVDYTHNWLWTSQFNKQGWSVNPGIAVRNGGPVLFELSAADGCVLGDSIESLPDSVEP